MVGSAGSIDWHGTMANILEDQLFLLKDRLHFSIDMFSIDARSTVVVERFQSKIRDFSYSDSVDYKKLLVDGKVHYVEYESFSSDGPNNFHWVEMYTPTHEGKSVRVIRGSVAPDASTSTCTPFEKIGRDEIKQLLENKDISADKTVWEYSIRHDGTPKIGFWEKHGGYRAVRNDNGITIEELGAATPKHVAKLAKKPRCEVPYSGDIAMLANMLKDNALVADICKTLGKYHNGSVEGHIISLMNNIADEKETVEKMDMILSSEEVVDNLNKRSDDGTSYRIVDVLHKALRMHTDEILEINSIVSKESDESAKDISERLMYGMDHLENYRKILKLAKMMKGLGTNAINSMENKELCTIVDKDLDGIIVKDKGSFDAVVAYVKSGCKLPKPDESNINDYRKVASDYVKDMFGLTKQITLDQINTLFSVDDKKTSRKVAKLFNGSEETNARYYSFGKSSVKDLNFSREELVKHSIVSILGSREKKAEDEAIKAVSSIVGDKAVYKAKNEFNSKHKHLAKDIIRAFKDTDYEKAYEILKTAKNESIMDVLNAANYRNVDLGTATFVKAVESKNPLDYDSGVQIACVYLPRGKDILNYSDDENMVLVRYDIGSKPLGSAICYLEGDKFLVDSVEGHRIFRDDKIFEIVYNDLIDRAREKGAKTVVFNRSPFNDTSKGFLEYLKLEKLPKRDVVKKMVAMKLDTECYLEANENVNAYVWKN